MGAFLAGAFFVLEGASFFVVDFVVVVLVATGSFFVDVAFVDVTFVDENDEKFNPLGARGIGEIGITGVAGALSNAVYHATGKRVRDLPITLDKLL